MSKTKQDKVTSLSKREVSANWLEFMGTAQLCRKLNDYKKKTAIEKSHKNSAKNIEVTKVLALDCEMVSNLNNENMLARVSIVNYSFNCIYDKYVKPTERVGDFRTRVSGIREENLVNGTDFETVRTEVKNLLRNKILVGHALGNDFKVLKFRHHKQLIRDTSVYAPFREVGSNSPSLKKLAKVFLDETIQEGEHDSIKDAQTAMKLYKKFRKEWELSIICLKYKKKSEHFHLKAINSLE